MNYQVVTILDSVLGQHRQFANNEYYYYCPFCHHHNPKLAVNLNKGMWQCWKCGQRGGKILSLFRKLDVSRAQIQELAKLLNEDLPQVKTEQTEVVLALPSEYRPLFTPHDSFDYKHAMAYVLRRGFTAQDILRYQIGYCETGLYHGRVIIPSFDASGALNYFVGRSYYEDATYTYMNPKVSKNVVGFDLHINWRHPIVITEGVFDAMAVKRNAIPLFGKTLSKKLQAKIIQENATDVYLALDRDALKETLTIAKKFMEQGINVHLVDVVDKDPAKLGFPAMQNLIRNAKKITFVDLIQLKLSLI